MKILHVVHGFLPEHEGGTERYVDRIARAQIAAGHTVGIAAGSIRPDYSGFTRDGEAADGTPDVYRISQIGSWAERWDHGDQPEIELELIRLLDENEIDLVHVHHWLRLSRGIVRAARSSGRPVVATAHDLTTTCPRLFRVRADSPFCDRPLSPESCLRCVPRDASASDEVITHALRAYARDMNAELHAADAVVVPSEAHRELIARYTNRTADAIDVLPHPRLEDTVARSDRTRAQRFRIAHWGNHVDFKGQHVLLEAVRQLEDPDGIELALWGSGDDAHYRARLDGLVAELHAAGVVVERRESFTREELARLSADLAVFPSLAHESWSFVVDEALCLGIPVVVSDRGAPAERVGTAGRTFATGDAFELAATLRELRADRGAVDAMKNACTGSGLDVADHVRRLEEIYGRARASQPERTERSNCVELDERVHAARLRRALEDRARHLGALYRDATEELEGTRQDVHDAFRLATKNERKADD